MSNILQNPSFESDDEWDYSDTGTLRDTAQSRTGVYSLRCIAFPANPGLGLPEIIPTFSQKELLLPGGVALRGMGCWVFATTNDPVRFRLTVREWLVFTEYYEYEYTPLTLSPGLWTYVEFPGQVDEADTPRTLQILFRFRESGGVGWLGYVDDTAIESVNIGKEVTIDNGRFPGYLWRDWYEDHYSGIIYPEDEMVLDEEDGSLHRRNDFDARGRDTLLRTRTYTRREGAWEEL